MNIFRFVNHIKYHGYTIAPFNINESRWQAMIKWYNKRLEKGELQKALSQELDEET